MRSNIACIAIIAISLFAISSNAQDSYLDTTFGNGGVVTAEHFEPNAMIVQQDGKIVVSTFSENGIIYRFNTDGSPDSGFGNNGKVVVNELISLVDIMQLPNGKILALGNRKVVIPGPMGYTRYYIVLVCLNSDGSLDETFGANGRTNHSLSYNSSSLTPYKMKLGADEKLYVTGRSGSSALIVKINLYGTIDTSFFQHGYISVGDYPGIFKCLDIFDNGNLALILEGGDIHDFFKLNSDGDLTQEVYGVELGSSADVVNDLEIIENNKMLVTGSRSGNTREGILMRLKNNGGPDTTFGTSGRCVISNDTGHDEAAMESIILENGRIVTGCQLWGDGSDFGLAFTTPSGTADTTVGNNGRIIINRPGNQKLEFIAQQQDGKIVAAGFDETNMILMRYDIPDALGTPSFEEKQISIYPNPATDIVMVTGLPEGAIVSLYTISGQKLLEVKTNGDTAIEISTLAKGIYFLNTAQGSAKIIKVSIYNFTPAIKMF